MEMSIQGDVNPSHRDLLVSLTLLSFCKFKIQEVKIQVCLPRKAVVKMSILLWKMFWQLLHDLSQLLDKINC